MKVIQTEGPNVNPVESVIPVTTWLVVIGSAVLTACLLAVFACWIVKRRSHLANKLGNKRGPDKALVFQPPRRATAVRSPGSQAQTHYLRKSPSPTAPQPPLQATTPHLPPTGNSHHLPISAASSPTSENPPPLSKELADASATEKPKVIELETPHDGRLGDLHFKLRYENEKKALVVSVVSCQELPGREPAGPDPYVKLQLLPDKQHKVKTRVVRKTRCPVYDEDFTFYNIAPHQLAGITLHFVVLSFDRYSRDEIIGEVVAPLANLQLANGEANALCREIQPRSAKMRTVCRGEVLVSLCWQPAASRLTVVLLKARNLPKMDVTGLADPYVKMYLLYNGQRIAKKKTHVKKRTLNPVFNESFVFEVPPAAGSALDHVSLELLVLDWDRVTKNECVSLLSEVTPAAGAALDHVSLELLVSDWDRVTKNEVIGRLELGAGAGGGGARQHWREVQAAPRRQIADWHRLRE